ARELLRIRRRQRWGAEAAASRRPAGGRGRIRRGAWKGHRFCTQDRHRDLTAGNRRGPDGRTKERCDLLVGQFDPVKLLVKVLDIGAEFLMKWGGEKQSHKPIQPDYAVDPWRVVDPPKRIGGSQVDAFLADRRQAPPGSAVQQRVIKASLLSDDDCGVPREYLIARNPRPLAPARGRRPRGPPPPGDRGG